jgi:hypothetical protein
MPRSSHSLWCSAHGIVPWPCSLAAEYHPGACESQYRVRLCLTGLVPGSQFASARPAERPRPSDQSSEVG